MEQFVLGVFQEQLSKFIIGFRKEQVNANLLNGKGDISNVELNCTLLNENLARLTPFIELESIHISKLTFVVTSWTNLRKAPIVVDIDTVTVKIREPLTYLDPTKRRKVRQVTKSEIADLVRQGLLPATSTRGPYNFLDRILDNLTIEISAVEITFQPAGKFKTRRPGPWTPPALHVQLAGLRILSVNEYAQVGTPEEVWQHNHDRFKHDESLFLYKKVEMTYKVSLLKHSHKPKEDSEDGKAAGANKDEATAELIPLISGGIDNSMEVQIAIERRIRNGDVLGVQLDATIPSAKIELSADCIPDLAHAAAGFLYCFTKDRAFDDPLAPEHEQQQDQRQPDTGEDKDNSAAPADASVTPTTRTGAPAAPGTSQEASASTGMPDVSSMAAAMMRSLSGELTENSSSSEEGADESDAPGTGSAPVNPDRLENQKGSDAAVAADSKTKEEESPPWLQQAPQQSLSMASSASSISADDDKNQPKNVQDSRQKVATSSKPTAPPQKDQIEPPILVLPAGLMIHEKVSLSISIHHATIRGLYNNNKQQVPIVADAETQGPANGAPDQEYVEVVARGVIAELIWPKATKEKGGYAQLSVAYVAMQERAMGRTRPLVQGGVHRCGRMGGVEEATPMPQMTDRDESFPLYEDRVIRPDPMDVRHSFPAQAVGLKTTIDIVPKIHPSGVSHSPPLEDFQVLHEIGVDRFNIVLDAEAWCRILEFVLHQAKGGLDPRWHSGDWSDCLTPDMLTLAIQQLQSGDNCSDVQLDLDKYIQGSGQVFLDENELISSDLLNLTAKITNLTMKIPAALEADLMSSDVVLVSEEMMLVVSSALPRTFLSGKIGTVVEENGSSPGIDFPNDPSDVVYALEAAEDPSNRQRGIMTSQAISTFRLQFTVRTVSITLEPVISLPAMPALPRQLMLPTEMTMIVCFEGTPPQSTSVSAEHLDNEDDDASDNSTKMVLMVSVLVHQLKLNIDLDMIARAASTLLHHASLVEETTQKFAKNLSSTLPDKPQQLTEQTATTTASGRIPKSLQGRRVLVKRQIHQIRSTGSISVAFLLQVAEFGLVVWRQHVAKSSPFRPIHDKQESEQRYLPLLKVFEFVGHNVEVGFEATLRQAYRRFVVKLCLEGLAIRACDFNTVSQNGEDPESGVWVSLDDLSSGSQKLDTSTGGDTENGKQKVDESETATESACMVDLMVLGNTNQGEKASTDYAMAIRLEELLKLSESSSRSWSFAMEVPAARDHPEASVHVNINVRALEMLVLLTLEALLLPSRREPGATGENMNLATETNAHFPEGTVGAFLLSLIPSNIDSVTEVFVDLAEEPASKEKNEEQTIPPERIDRFLRATLTKLFPADLKLFLLKGKMHDVLVEAPSLLSSDSTTSGAIGFLLHDMDFTVCYFAPAGESEEKRHPILEVLAQKGETWSSVLECGMTCDSGAVEEGLCHGMQSRQSICHHTGKRNGLDTEDAIMSPFDFGYRYSDGKTKLHVQSGVSIDSVEPLDDCLRCLLDFVGQCRRMSVNVSRIFAAIKEGDHKEGNHSRPPVEAGRGMSGIGSSVPQTPSQAVSDKPPTEQREVSSTTPPAVAACARTFSSIRSMSASFSHFNKKRSAYEQDLRLLVEQKDKQLANMQMLLFAKERERVGAIALASSQAVGWLRIGSPQRIGQRGLMTCMLWPQWSTLRKSLLILYGGPGQYKPADMIALERAKLRQLTGGARKRDVKRAFGIVEQTGVVHLVVASSDAEYYNWVRELQRAIEACTPANEGETDGDASLHSFRAAPQTPRMRPSGGSPVPPFASLQGGALGNSLSRAVQAAKATRQAVAERRQRKRDERNERNLSTSLHSLSSGVETEISGSAAASTDVVTPSSLGHIRSRIADVGRATRSRFGSRDGMLEEQTDEDNDSDAKKCLDFEEQTEPAESAGHASNDHELREATSSSRERTMSESSPVGNFRRPQQIRNKLSEVSQAARNRFGSSGGNGGDRNSACREETGIAAPPGSSSGTVDNTGAAAAGESSSIMVPEGSVRHKGQNGSGGFNRGQQIRNRFAGIGQSARNRFGSNDSAGEDDYRRTASSPAGTPRPENDQQRGPSLASPTTTSGQVMTNETSEGMGRRQLLRNKIAGVGQVTKSRFGSALQAARQKGRDVAEKRLNRMNLHKNQSSAEVGGRGQSTQVTVWACSSCTFNNPADASRCEMCLTVREGPPIPSLGSDQPDEHVSQVQEIENPSVVVDSSSGADLAGVLVQDDSVPIPAADSSHEGVSGKDNNSGTPKLTGRDAAPRQGNVAGAGASGDGPFVEGNKTPDKTEEFVEPNSLTFTQVVPQDSLSQDADSVQSDFSDDMDGEGLESRRTMGERLGAAVQRVRGSKGGREVSTASGRNRFSLLRGRNMGQDAMDAAMQGAPDSVRLRNVSLGDSLNPVHPFGEGNSPQSDLPLRCLNRNLFVRVEAIQPEKGLGDLQAEPSQDDTEEAGGQCGTSDGANDRNDLLSVEEKEEPEGKEGVPQIPTAESSDSAPGKDSRNRQRLNSESGNSTSSYVTQFPGIAEASFRILIFEHELSQNRPIVEIEKKFSDLLALHTALSDTVSRLPSHVAYPEKDDRRTTYGNMQPCLRRALGLSALDTVRVTGRLLGGLLEPASHRREGNETLHYCAEVISEFLNSVLDCPLPVDGLASITEFLCLSDASTRTAEPEGANSTPGPSYQRSDPSSPNGSSQVAADVASLSAICESELLHAEKQCLVAERLTASGLLDATTSSRGFGLRVTNDPVMPVSLKAMHSAIMKVMEERDVARAKMAGSDVLHIHEMEQQRKKAVLVSAKLEACRNVARNVANAPSLLFGPQDSLLEMEKNKLKKVEREMQQNTDAELISLCQLLSSEISTRTLADLEIERLKESRALEQKTEKAERRALNDELILTKELLQEERLRTQQAKQESSNWKESYEELLLTQETQNSC